MVSKLNALVAVAFAVVILTISFNAGLSQAHGPVLGLGTVATAEGGDPTVSAPHRKLLSTATKVEPKQNKLDECSKSYIQVSQGATAPLPNGIPTYTVEIANVCPSDCSISDIHLSCGEFSSTNLVNPKIFRRLRVNDCLVNDGNPLVNGRTLSFVYSNTFKYPLAAASLVCRRLPRRPNSTELTTALQHQTQLFTTDSPVIV